MKTSAFSLKVSNCIRILFSIRTISILASCTDKQKELDELIESYKQAGKDIIVKSDSTYFFIYESKDTFWLKYLDKPDQELFSKNIPVKCVYYFWSLGDNGTLSVDTTIYEENLSPDFFDKDKILDGENLSFDKNRFKIYNEEALVFEYKEIIENPTPQIVKRTYICYLSKPNILYASNQKFDDIDMYPTEYGRHEKMSFYAGSLAQTIGAENIFPYCFGYNMAEGGYFDLDFYVDSEGKVSKIDSYIQYNNEFDEDLRMSFYLSDFSSKERIRVSLSKIIDKKEEELKEYILNNAITLEELNEACKNEIKFERDYLYKDLYFDCKAEYIEKVSGWFEPEYKYKIVANAVVVLGQWWSDYDMKGYTNDENFVNLSYPCRIIMKAKLYSGNGRKFEFRDCQLLYFGEYEKDK